MGYERFGMGTLMLITGRARISNYLNNSWAIKAFYQVGGVLIKAFVVFN